MRMKQIGQTIIGKIPERFSQKKIPKVPLIIVALISGTIGTYVLIQSFAETPTSCTKTLSSGGNVQTFVGSLSGGDTGCLRSGSYTTSGDLNFSTSDVTLTSYPGERATINLGSGSMARIADGATHVTIKRLNLSTNGYHTIRVFGNHAVLEGVDFTNNHANGAGACIGVGGSEGKPTGVIIRLNKIHDCGGNGTNLNHGIYANTFTDLLITDNLFWGNGGYSVQLYPDTTRATVSHNVIDGSKEYSVRGGVVIDGSTAVDDIIEYNIIANTATAGITTRTGSGHQANYNCFDNNSGGNISGSNISQEGNIDTSPQFVDRASHDYTLRSGTGCLPLIQYDTAAKVEAAFFSGSTTPSTSPLASLPFTNGTVVAADYAKTDNPVTEAWNYVTNGYFLGSTFVPSGDPQITWAATGGDPLPAFDGQVHTGYRSLTTEGNQAIWDAKNQPDSTRAQLGGWTGSEIFHAGEVGTRELTGFSVRLDPDTPLPYDQAPGGGNTKYSTIVQWKSATSSSVNGKPPFIFNEGKDGVKMVYNGPSGLIEEVISPKTGFTVPRGKWIRFALDINYSTTTSGAYRLWGDLDGSGVFKPLTPKHNVITVIPGYTRNVMNIGPYHKLSLPKNGRDYANVNVLKHSVSDPWDNNGSQSGEILWKGDGSEPLDQQWSEVSDQFHCGSSTYPGIFPDGRINMDTTSSIATSSSQGRAIHFFLAKGDNCYIGRTELLQNAYDYLDNPTNKLFKNGDDIWIAMEFYLPDTYPLNGSAQSAGGGAWQLHTYGGCGINLGQGSSIGPDSTGIPGQGKYRLRMIADETCNTSYPSVYETTVRHNQWYKIMMHVKFENDKTGFFYQYFDKNDGKGMQLVYSCTSCVTNQYNTDDPNGDVGMRSHIGLYPGSTVVQDMDLYVAGYTVATSRAAAEANAFPGGGSTPPPPDTTAPSVSITSPSDGATVSGSKTVSANASDDTGVANVQFKLDGANLGSADTSSPYSINWDTTKAANGSHILTAVATDTAGNTKTFSAVNVTVSNAPQASCDGSTDLICEDFSSNANNFTTSNGTWSVSGGQYKLNPPQDNPDNIGLHNRAIHGTNVNGDFVANVDASVDNTSSNWNDFGVVFNYQDSNNYYFLSFNESNDNYTHGIFRVVNGVQTQLADIPASMTPGTTYAVKVEKTGSTINAYLNGSLAATTTDSTFTSGQVGLASRDDPATFDNLRVASTEPAPDTTAPTVSITSPSDGETVSDIVTATANASDDVGVTYVVFSLDGTLKLADNASPYNYSFDSKTLTNGSHTLSAKAYDAAGNTKTATITINVNNPDTTAPSAPSNLSATAADSTTVNLSWSASTDSGTNATGVAGYNILRNGAVVAQTTETSYTDSGLAADTAYSYVVQAYDKAGNVSNNSNEATVTTPQAPDTTLPSTPSNLNANVVSSTQINLSWNASTDSGGSGLAGYNVYRDGNKLNSSLVTMISYGDSTLSPESTYSYTVEAVDGAGNKSELSLPVSATTLSSETSGGTSSAVQIKVVDSSNQPVSNAQATLNGQREKTDRLDGIATYYDVPVGDASLKVKSKGDTTSHTVDITGDSTQTTPETILIEI